MLVIKYLSGKQNIKADMVSSAVSYTFEYKWFMYLCKTIEKNSNNKKKPFPKLSNAKYIIWINYLSRIIHIITITIYIYYYIVYIREHVLLTNPSSVALKSYRKKVVHIVFRISSFIRCNHQHFCIILTIKIGFSIHNLSLLCSSDFYPLSILLLFVLW